MKRDDFNQVCAVVAVAVLTGLWIGTYCLLLDVHHRCVLLQERVTSLESVVAVRREDQHEEER